MCEHMRPVLEEITDEEMVHIFRSETEEDIMKSFMEVLSQHFEMVSRIAIEVRDHVRSPSNL